MKRFLLSTLAAIALCGTSAAQDLIIHRNGSEQQVRILEISSDEVKYKKWSNQNGPTYTIPTSDIFMIKYPDGSKDTFPEKKPQEKPYNEMSVFAPQNTTKPMLLKKERDTRLEIGARIMPTMSLLFLESGYDPSAGKATRGTSGIRFFGSAGATIEYHLSKYESGKWFLHGGLEYALRGGDIGITGADIVRTDYLNLEFGIGVRGRLAYWIPGFRLGILTNSKMIYKGIKTNEYKTSNPVIFEFFQQFGFCIGKHIDLGWNMSIVPTNIFKPETWTGNNRSWSYNFGVMFTYRFKIKKNQQTDTQQPTYNPATR